MEYIRWRGVISQQSIHTEPVLDDQYSSSEVHILVEFQCETVKKWVIHCDDGELLFVRSESHREAAMTSQTRLDYAAANEDLKQLLLEKLETYDLRDDQNCKEKLADKVIYQARKLGSTGKERSSSLFVNIRKTLFYVVRESVSQLGEIGDGVKMVPASMDAILSLPKKEMDYNGDEFGNCTVCLEEIVKGVEVSTLLCSHMFHSNCITEWLKRSHYCPICRFEMPIAMN
ncbi:Ubiquitin-- ligase [Olea europaea subsp. europaea]|uniref:RING-type E3 ubiquitin transferase n=1 Tax=Olea europaea subsp. europaea TaxID=158383 RepID=A0A8S0SNU1_OLEEU|nr:Ubiquitin-- ligase [Olea europaea subsp. europaea]